MNLLSEKSKIKNKNKDEKNKSMDTLRSINDISVKPNYNIGLLGSLANGKSTIIKILCDKDPHTSTKELVRNITMNAGFGNMYIFKNKNNNDLISTNTNKKSITKKFKKLDEDINDYEIIKHISFVDCPGHSKILHVPLSNIKLMNGVIVVINVKDDLETKPQLIQHLIAVSVQNIKDIIICLNKIDLVDEKTCIQKKKQVKQILNHLGIEPTVILPTSFTRNINIDKLLYCINKVFHKKDSEKYNNNTLLINRSFNINSSGIDWKKLKGGILGGSVITGKFKVGDEIEIRPGYTNKGKNDNEKMKSFPIKSTILSIYTETSPILNADKNGLIAIGTDIEPFYCQNNKLAGNIIGLKDDLPSVYTEIDINFEVLKNKYCNWNPKINDLITVFIETSFVNSKLIKVSGKKKYKGTIKLFKPICVRKDSNIMICQNCRKDNIVKIVGNGNFIKGKIIVE